MNSKVEQSKAASAGDIVKYVLAVLLVAAGVFAFYWWPESQFRWLAVIGGVIAGLAVFMTSHKGHDTREFLAESRFELRKVVWPTRQEAGRATVMIIIAVTVISLILALMDWIIQHGVKLLLSN